MNVTTNDVTPTCAGRIKGGNVNTVFTNRDPIVQRPTVKAVSCLDGESSEVSSRTFEIEQAFVVEMTVRLQGTIGSSDLNDDAKRKFLKGLADLIHVPAELMFMVSVNDAKRRLLSVDLTVGVLANSDASAQQVKSDILKADLVGLINGVVNELGLQGLVSGIGKIDVINLRPSKGTPAPAPEPEKKSNTGVIVGSVVGAICFICVTSSVAHYFLSLRSKKNLAEKPVSAGERVVTPPPTLGSEDGRVVTRVEPEEEELSGLADFNRDIQLRKDYSEVMCTLQGTSDPMSPVAISLRPSRTVITPVAIQSEAALAKGSLGFVHYAAIEKAREGVNDDVSGAAVTRRFQKNLESVEHWKSQMKPEREPAASTDVTEKGKIP